MATNRSKVGLLADIKTGRTTATCTDLVRALDATADGTEDSLGTILADAAERLASVALAAAEVRDLLAEAYPDMVGDTDTVPGTAARILLDALTGERDVPGCTCEEGA